MATAAAGQIDPTILEIHRRPNRFQKIIFIRTDFLFNWPETPNGQWYHDVYKYYEQEPYWLQK